jgi:hypothetical protein
MQLAIPLTTSRVNRVDLELATGRKEVTYVGLGGHRGKPGSHH